VELPDRVHLELECVLTREEVADASKRLVDTLTKREIIGDRLKQEKAKAKAELEILEGQGKRLAHMVKSERETREVLCGISYDWKKGEKSFSRLDTGEVARVEKITPSERQKEIQ
jgi:hypothetical protein